MQKQKKYFRKKNENLCVIFQIISSFETLEKPADFIFFSFYLTFFLNFKVYLFFWIVTKVITKID